MFETLAEIRQGDFGYGWMVVLHSSTGCDCCLEDVVTDELCECVKNRGSAVVVALCSQDLENGRPQQREVEFVGCHEI